MAGSRLKIKKVAAPAGSFYFSVAELAFCRIVKIAREAKNFFLESELALAFASGVTLDDGEVVFVRSEGKFVFPFSNPFSEKEIVYIIYKEPSL